MSEKNSTVQEKLNELSELVKWFHDSNFQLEEAVDKFHKAEALAKDVEKDLQKIKNNIKIVNQDFKEAGK